MHHSDRGVQYLAIRYTERLAEAGIEPSASSRGDSHDNALAESVIGFVQNGGDSPPRARRNLQDVEFATLEWIAWFNTRRLLKPMGTSRRPSTRQPAMVVSRPQLSWRHSREEASGEAGAIHGSAYHSPVVNATLVTVHLARATLWSPQNVALGRAYRST